MKPPIFWHCKQKQQDDSAVEELDFAKGGGIMPAIVQHELNGEVLMVGYMNPEALRRTLSGQQVCFFSRSKKTLWVKGETSGHYLHWVLIMADCDQDTLLITAHPQGPTCHFGTPSCFHTAAAGFAPAFHSTQILFELEEIIEKKATELSDKKPEFKAHAQENSPSYTQRLLAQGLSQAAQKVGEEAVELLIASMAQGTARVRSEAADLMYHLLVLLRLSGVSWQEVLEELKARRKKDYDAHIHQESPQQ